MAATLALQLAVIYVPALNAIFHTQPLDAAELALCLGLSARSAFEPHARRAVRGALVPSVDTTRVVGLISLPGAMTGLILAGVEPLAAIRYQIVVMYMLLAAWAVAALVTERLAERWLFDDAERLVPVAAATG